MMHVRDREELVMSCILLWEKWNTHFFVCDVMRSDDDVMMLYPYVPRVVCRRMEQSLMKPLAWLWRWNELSGKSGCMIEGDDT